MSEVNLGRQPPPPYLTRRLARVSPFPGCNETLETCLSVEGDAVPCQPRQAHISAAASLIKHCLAGLLLTAGYLLLATYYITHYILQVALGLRWQRCLSMITDAESQRTTGQYMWVVRRLAEIIEPRSGIISRDHRLSAESMRSYSPSSQVVIAEIIGSIGSNSREHR